MYCRVRDCAKYGMLIVSKGGHSNRIQINETCSLVSQAWLVGYKLPRYVLTTSPRRDCSHIFCTCRAIVRLQTCILKVGMAYLVFHVNVEVWMCPIYKHTSGKRTKAKMCGSE